MVALYYLLVSIAHFCATPILALMCFKQKYKNALRFRFFTPQSLDSNFSYHWLHACSFGEVNSLFCVISALESKLDSKTKILITTTTKTGYNQALKRYPNCAVRYLPFESFIPFWLFRKKILSLTLLEAEFWLMPLVCAKLKGAKTFSLNARISTRSLPRYLKFKFFYKLLFSYILQVFSQSQMDTERLISLGAREVITFGNLKLAQTPQISANYHTNAPLWVIASTHKKDGILEEELILQEILQALQLTKDSTFKEAHFIFAPRHLERISEVENTLNTILTKNNLTKLVKTSKEGIENALNSPFILLDSLGELNNIYAIAKGVILGGSFLENIGGHNPIEPAFFNTKLISGKYIFNQHALFSAVSGYVLCDIKELHKILLQPLEQSYIKQSLNIEQFIKALKE